MDEFLKVSYLFSPLLVGLAFHGLCMKFGWLRSLASPIDGGKTLRGERLFGANKTYRGVIAVALGTAVGVGLQDLLHYFRGMRNLELLDHGSPAILGLGLAMGAAAMLSELPNSLLKRQLGIVPGAAGRGVVGVMFYVLDQVDMLLGAWVVVGFAVPITATRLLWSVLFLFIAHQLLTVVGYGLGMRGTVR
ncbi:MAG TPA: CDP-archaeol synthase [Pyrinomonadaceae bacterium]|nr:CDP-archaeol synthase [Pyrinomonadaceae bacterium]